MVVMIAGCAGDDAEPVDEGAIVEEPSSPPPSAAPATPAAPGALAPGVTADMFAAGQQIFVGQGLCFTCHGQDAQGTPLAPNLTDDTWLNIEAPEQELYSKVQEVVRTGVPQPVEHPAPMPPMGGSQLTDEQVQAVAGYVASLSA